MGQKQNYRNLASRFAGYISNLTKPKIFVRFIIFVFRKIYRINLDEFIIPEGGFKNFNSFFTRKFKKEFRPISNHKIISPVDGYVVDYGPIDSEKKIFVKHKYYFVEDLISDSSDFVFKSYSVFYLSPKNYHRVHAPFDCEINSVSYFPGTLFSVRHKTVMKRDNVFCRNERIVIYGNSIIGKFCIIMVGAIIVGKVRLSFDSEIQTNIRKGEIFSKNYFHPVNILKGEEIGLFELGSTVIILLEDQQLSELRIKKQSSVKMGISIL